MLRTLALIPLVLAGQLVLAAYPDKPIRMVVISAPGGTTDILSRLLAQQMGEGLGQQVVTDNRPGGGGIIAAEITARANPDGYTLLYTHTSHSVLPSLHKNLPYDAVRDFTPVSLFAIFPGVLIVNNAVPVKSVRELIELARSQPGKLNYASGTTGATAHLSGELLKSMAHISIVNVPYKGTGAELVTSTPGEFAVYINGQIAKWAKVVEFAGVRAD